MKAVDACDVVSEEIEDGDIRVTSSLASVSIIIIDTGGTETSVAGVLAIGSLLAALM